MKVVFQGKTKNVYELADGNYLLEFKDDLTGKQGVFDPGADEVGLRLEGSGRAALRLTKYFFEILEKKQIPTHYLQADPDNMVMTVQSATPFGQGLEVICRYRAVGSFYRRYGKYVGEGTPLDAFVEVTLKDDQRHDPPISKDALIMLRIISSDEYEVLIQLTRTVSAIVKEELEKKGIELYDIKLEFGRIGKDGHIALIDEISGENMRAYRDGKLLDPLTLERLVLDEP